MSPPETNAPRILDAMGIRYELRSYAADNNHLDAAAVADRIGMPPDQVQKTLLARGDPHGVCFAVLAAHGELAFKALARASGDRQVALVPPREVTILTGYERGGVTVLGAKKAYPVFVDELFEIHDLVSVSAGVRGTQILLAPAD
ncbi:MAG: aminoacyl-tRNA deacylase [Polyangiaceae bacterium]|nr:aminoacyl-tRNA deacylase [Polyangiaceae bacterium]